MKLNPPASSSDLELARQIARRLHQNRRRDDPAAAGWPGDEAPVRPRLSPPPLPPRPAAAVRDEAAEAAAIEPPRVTPPPPPSPPSPAAVARPAPRPEPERPAIEPEPAAPSFGQPPADAYERPAWSAPAVEAPAIEEPAIEEDPAERTIADEDDDRAPLEDLASPDEPAPYEPPEPVAPPEPELPDVAIDVEADGEDALSPEAMVGEAEPEGSPLDQLTEPDDSPFDDALLDAPPVAEEEPPTPSWDDVVESCRNLAAAGGAMLIDPAGQVFAARGDWPAPGPDQIAGKLVAMMAKTLKDAPTRSISAPLMGKHLTAWRVPISEGLMTVAFIGAAPVRADARPAIDQEILSGVRA